MDRMSKLWETYGIANRVLLLGGDLGAGPTSSVQGSLATDDSLPRGAAATVDVTADLDLSDIPVRHFGWLWLLWGLRMLEVWSWRWVVVVELFKEEQRESELRCLSELSAKEKVGGRWRWAIRQLSLVALQKKDAGR